MKSLKLELFCTFLKIGAFTFGGGYAMIPLIEKEIVEEKNWMNEEDITEIVVVAESTPGPIAVNAATMVGTKVAGFWGAVAATFGVVLPSFLIILLISTVLHQFESLQIVKDAFWGIRIAVLALICKAFWSMLKQCQKNWFSYVLMILAFSLVIWLHVNSILIIVAAAVLGMGAAKWKYM